MQRLLQKAVEVTVNIEESRLPDFQNYVEAYGVLQFSISKPLKFEDLGLAAIENGYFQCLACSKTFKWKQSAVLHFKNFHTDRPLESKVQCPRCSDELAKSALNSHMEQKHQLKNFNQLLKRSYIPDKGNLFKGIVYICSLLSNTQQNRFFSNIIFWMETIHVWQTLFVKTVIFLKLKLRKKCYYLKLPVRRTLGRGICGSFFLSLSSWH